jgi:hypothetical chaperone protein
MRIGIDFGTSYSAAAAVIDGEVALVRFDGEPQFRTAVYFPEHLPDGEAVRRHREGAPASVASARRVAEALFGDAAVEAYLLEGEGHLVDSPKSMLGYQLHPRAKDTITAICARILAHVREQASAQFGVEVREAVLGRPVRFRSSMGAQGEAQALALLREAAGVAGFEAVDFLEEPVAAALQHHAGSPARHAALVFDIGGGTTDVAWAELGGAEAPRVLGSWGLAEGGTDFDLALSLERAMPLFGRGLSRVPNHHFVEAAMVQDLPRQLSFRKHDYDEAPAPFAARLRALQAEGAPIRLHRAVEGLKRALSDGEAGGFALDWIEDGLAVDARREHLEAAARMTLGRMRALLEAIRAERGAPDAVVFTGGMSRAPLVRALAAEVFPGVRQVLGEASLGVVAGLARAAAAG